MNPRMESPRNSSLSFDASLCCAPEACVKAASSSDLSLNSYPIRRWHSATSMAASALSRCSRRDMNSNAFWTKPKACFACMSNRVPIYFRGFSFGIEPSLANGRMMERALVALVATGLECPPEGWPTLGVPSLDSLFTSLLTGKAGFQCTLHSNAHLGEPSPGRCSRSEWPSSPA